MTIESLHLTFPPRGKGGGISLQQDLLPVPQGGLDTLRIVSRLTVSARKPDGEMDKITSPYLSTEGILKIALWFVRSAKVQLNEERRNNPDCEELLRRILVEAKR